jgi:hypothetical protein
VRKALEEKVPHGTHWSTRLMAKETGLHATQISRIWRAHGLKPHRIETFKLSTAPQFIEKLRELVGLYVAPPERAVVFSFEEKSQIQALDRTQRSGAISTSGTVRRSTRVDRVGGSDHREGRAWK